MRCHLFLVAVTSLVINPSRAQWQSLGGPEGGTINILFESSDGTLYAANYQHLYKRLPATDAWLKINRPSENASVLCLGENSKNEIYIGLSTDASHTSLYKRSANATNWQPLPLGGNDTRALIFNEMDDLIIEFGNSIYLSTDGGMTGNRIEVAPDLNILLLENHPSGIILAGTTRGLYYSRDQGENWIIQLNGLPDDIYVLSLAVANNGIIAINDTQNNIYISENFDDGFESLPGPDSENISTLEFDENGTLHCSTMKGKVFLFDGILEEWQMIFETSRGEQRINDLLFNQNQDLLIATRGEGIYKRGIDGFEPFNKNLSASIILSCIPIKDQLIVSSITSFYRWQEDARSWNEIQVDDQYQFSRDMLGIDSSLVVAATTNGVKKIDFLKIDEITSENLGLDGLRINFVYQSQDQALFAGTFNDGLFRSSDSGFSWLDVSTEEMRNSTLTSMTSLSGDTLFVGTNLGIQISTDGGSTWKWSISNIPSVSNLIASKDQKTIFATSPPGILRSEDRGMHWESFHISPDRPAYEILENIDGVLYAGMEVEGIYRSLDKGETWEKYPEGLQIGTVISLAKNAKGDLFAGTDGGGVFILENTSVGLNDLKKSGSVIRVFPNPTSSSVSLSIGENHKGPVQFKLISTTGNIIKKIKIDLAGKTDFNWHLDQVPPGHYYITFESGKINAVEKLVIMQ